MGLSSKKTTTTENSTQHATETPNVPDWGVSSLAKLNEHINSLANDGPAQRFVADANPLQTQAGAGAANLGSAWSAPLAQATGDVNDVTSAATPQSQAAHALAAMAAAAHSTAAHSTAAEAQAAQAQAAHALAASLLDGGGISQYLNPELQAVVDTSLAGFDKDAGATKAALAAKGALNSAFGGSRYGILEGETNADLAQKRGLLESGLRASAYSDAANQANQDAARRQSTSEANAGRDTQISDSNANRATQVSQDNANRATQVSQDNASRDTQVSQDNAARDTNISNENAARDTQISDSNAGRDTTVSLANAQQAADALARKLQGAGLLTNIGNSAGANARADIGTQADVGAQLRDIDQAKATAPISLTQALASLLGQNQLGLLTGHTTDGTSSGTSTTVSNPSTLSAIGQGLQAATSLASLFAGMPGLGGMGGGGGAGGGFLPGSI